MSLEANTHKGTYLKWPADKRGHNAFTIHIRNSNGSAYDISAWTLNLYIFAAGFPDSPVLTLTQDSGITNGGETGDIGIALTLAQSNIKLSRGEYNYRLDRTEDSLTYNLFYGPLILRAETNPGSTNSETTATVNLGDTVVNVSVTLGGGGGASTAEDVSFEPTGNISSDNVQDAIEELDSEKLSSNLSGVNITGAPTLQDGAKWTFKPGETTAGLNVGAGTPEVDPDFGDGQNGDIWYDNTANEFKVVTGGLVQTLIHTGGTYISSTGSGLTTNSGVARLGGSVTSDVVLTPSTNAARNFQIGSGFGNSYNSIVNRTRTYLLYLDPDNTAGSNNHFLITGGVSGEIFTVKADAAIAVRSTSSNLSMDSSGTPFFQVAPTGTTIFNTSGSARIAVTSEVALSGAPTAPTATQGTNSTQIATTAFVKAEIAATAGVGTQDLPIMAPAMWPRATNGCASLARTEMATSIVNIQSLDFDQTTQEFAQFQIVLPRNWNRGTVTARFYWTAASGSGGVVWAISGGAYSNDDALTTALGTAQTVADTLIATNDLHITDYTSAITIAGSPADADFLVFQISRNPSDGSDTLTADAKLLGVVITLTTDSGVAS